MREIVAQQFWRSSCAFFCQAGDRGERGLYVPAHKDQKFILNLGAGPSFFCGSSSALQGAVNLRTVWTDSQRAAPHRGLRLLDPACVCGHVKIALSPDSVYPFAGELLSSACLSSARRSASFGSTAIRRKSSWAIRVRSIGSMLGVAICTKQELLLVAVGGVWVIGNLGAYPADWFEITKRVARARSTHLALHHFELKGWKEKPSSSASGSSRSCSPSSVSPPSNFAECAIRQPVHRRPRRGRKR